MEKLIWKVLNLQSQRILGQIDRDPDSPTYGCFDRNFWNYKIRDFASIIQQQGILVLDALYTFDAEDNPYFNAQKIHQLTKAGIRFWESSQLKSGAFNEYYPFESGFPPTAFSLYAVATVLHKKHDWITDNTYRSLERAADWLLDHQETEALNQESAALAGLVITSKIDSSLVDSARLNDRLRQFFEAQSEEGWFPEYGGPDLGYLSVTIDSLWDIYLQTDDPRALQAAIRASHFIFDCVSVSGELPVMTNSRNTDYVVPYGIAGLASIDTLSNTLLGVIIKNLTSESSMYAKTDDRYLTHYIGQSYFRTLSMVKASKLNLETGISRPPITKYFPQAQWFVKHTPGKSFLISLAKGGICYTFDTEGLVQADYGHRIKKNKKIAVTHWQNPENCCSCNIENDIATLEVSGKFTLHSYLRPTPLKHMVLRILAYFFGNRLITKLKAKMIFNKAVLEVGFQRTIVVEGNQLHLNDTFSDAERFNIIAAPHYSLRHVSSAGRFVEEELL